ncbi:MAG: glycosyltransferase [Actinomycetota bacterium]|nr:glycosyltransferase [Actinomycetota bacterium]
MTTPVPPPFVGPENDYRPIAGLEPGSLPSIAIVIPAYERPAVLDRTLAGVAALDYPTELLEILVVDDGSEADLQSIVENTSMPFPIAYERQDVPGRAAGQARNLGVRMTTGEVLIFLDADCIPAPDLVRQHASWHRRASNVVVVGARFDVDTGAIATNAIVSRFDELAAATNTDHNESGFGGWRSRFHRRTKQLMIADSAYRACLSNNLSVRRERFEAVGGFSPLFTEWGGEDTELGWRLWNAGAFIVPDGAARVLHQTQGDLLDGQQQRMAARERSLGLISDLIPQRFYRKAPTPLATIPKVTWIARVDDKAEAKRIYGEASAAAFTDTEFIGIGDRDALGPILSPQGTKTSIVGTFAQAVDVARGEFLVFVDGRARFDRRLLARAMRRFDDSRVGAVRIGYRSGTQRVLRLTDLQDADSGWGRDGLPFFALVRRRELMKDEALLCEPAGALAAVFGRSRVELLVTDLVTVPDEIGAGMEIRRPGVDDLRAAGIEEIARGARRAIVSPSLKSAEPVATDDRVSIDYVGYTGRGNLGDEAVLAAIQSLMPWARIERDADAPRMLMLGGGTLINGRRYYQTRILRNDRPSVERAVFGTGVRSPDFWGVTEPMDEWWSFFDSAGLVSVRGPDSVRYLRDLGYTGNVEMIGDPALSLERPDGVSAVDGRVVVSPVFTEGRLHGGDDRPVFAALSNTIARLSSEGRDVVLMTAFPSDDRWAIEIMRQAGRPDLTYVPGYANLDATLDLLASSELVIGERLHAAVLAASVGTPFVAVEYRPKLRDFARSIGREDSVVRTDEVERLDSVVDAVLSDGERIAAEVGAAVATLRERQRDAAGRLHVLLEG